jgi:hypothetical protein
MRDISIEVNPMPSNKSGLADQATLDELDKKGMAIYDRLKDQLEAESLNRCAAIHVGTGEFSVASSAIEAMRSLLRIHGPDGQLFVRKIGDEPEYDLAARILAGELVAGAQK